jgi:hypothetical protein
MIEAAMLVALGAAASSCAVMSPATSLPLGTSIDEARHAFGGPSGEYALAGGGTRLEFRQHRQTYMLDFDAGGHLVARQQVLKPAVFATMKPGMTRDEVLALIGHPVGTFPVGWQQLQVWSYRFPPPEGDCVLWQVSIGNATGRVTDVGPNMDPACDGPNRAK